MRDKFSNLFIDRTKDGTKISTDKYLESGKFKIIDQGQSYIAGYTNTEEGIFSDVPAIVFGDHTRCIKYVDFPFFLGADGVKVLKSTKNNANYKYWYYALKNVSIPNTGYNRHFKWLKEATFTIHAEDEQKHIVEVLDKLTSLIQHKQEQLSKLDELVKSRFVELFGDPQTNPNRYALVKLSDVATYFNGLTYKPENVVEIGTIVLRSSNIQNSQLDFADTVRVDCTVKEKLMVQENDILMCSRNGSARLVGKVALIKGIHESMTFGAFMMIIRSRYHSYLMTYFQMDAFRQQIKTGATTTINQITGRMLDDVTIPLPPMELVEQFAAFVEQTDKSKFEIQKSLEETQKLFDSLMQEYFG